VGQFSPDSGYELKEKFFPQGIGAYYRIEIEQYDVGRPGMQ
jgi:hypothetical protein